MTKFPVLALCAAALLSACSSPIPQEQFGADGRPLPRVYKMSKADEAEIPYRVLDSLNTLRSAKGVAPVQLNAQLSAAAAAHSRDMAAQNRPWHFGSDGSSPLLRAQRAGYPGHFMGELIAETYETEMETLADWSTQADTRGVLLEPMVNELGFAWYQEANGKVWWTLVTGDSTRPPVANVNITALGRETTSEMDNIVGQ